MTSQQWLNVISIAGSFLSLVGVTVTVYQVVKTRRAAEAARSAAQQAQLGIAHNVLLVDVTTRISQLDEIKILVRAKRYEAALLRVGDLSAGVTQMRGVILSDSKKPVNFKRTLTQLGVLRDLLEQRLHDDGTPINPVQVNTVLSDISAEMHEWIGGAKYLPAEETHNG